MCTLMHKHFPEKNDKKNPAFQKKYIMGTTSVLLAGGNLQGNTRGTFWRFSGGGHRNTD